MKYFTMKELTKSSTADKLGIDNTPTPEASVALSNLVTHVLDPLREMYGKAITVNSGYRCPKLNAAVGGAKNSQHMRGIYRQGARRRIRNCSSLYGITFPSTSF